MDRHDADTVTLPDAHPALSMVSFGIADAGKVRAINEDQSLHAEAEPEQACRRLVTRANVSGGRDNITAVVAHFHLAD